MNASSEIIESMFGKRKERDGDNKLTQNGVNILEMYLYGQSMQKLDAKIIEAMEGISIPVLRQWTKDNFPENQSYARKKFMRRA